MASSLRLTSDTDNSPTVGRGEARRRIGERGLPRRSFLAIVGGTLLVSPLRAGAQPAGKVPRIGYVTSSARSVNVDAFDQGLRELGYTIGQDIVVERSEERRVGKERR